MNWKELKKYCRSNTAVLFKITSRCNENCAFCIEKKFMKRGKDDLSLKEIKNNFDYLNENFNIDYAIISGGEPTLHHDFFKILDFFCKKGVEFRVITNLIKLGEKKFFKKILPYFSSFVLSTGRKNKIIGSINDLPEADNAKRRIVGLKNVLKSGLPLMLIAVIYKKNLERLPELIYYLANLFKRYGYDKPINLELRLIYVEGTLSSLLKKSLPDDFQKIEKFTQEAVYAANNLGITLTLWNFPLCYLKKLPDFQDKSIQERRQRKLLKVNKDFQGKKIKIRDFEEYFRKDRICVKCKYNNFCSGIDGVYLEKYHFPSLKPVK